MRIVMPLFQFSYFGSGFKFSEYYSLESFDAQKEIFVDINMGLSQLDCAHISQAQWALVATDPAKDFKSEVNLLLIAFKIYAQSNVFIKWRFCKEKQEYSTCLNDRFRNLISGGNDKVTDETLNTVRDGFAKVTAMYAISDRTKNALYFIWRGFCAEKHIDAYILLVCALESLFSSETAEDTTKILIKRIQGFLKARKGFGGDRIKEIYKIRSDMVHGRISYTGKDDFEKRERNLSNLAKLEKLIIVCMKEILESQIYLSYRSMKEEQGFLNSLYIGKSDLKT